MDWIGYGLDRIWIRYEDEYGLDGFGLNMDYIGLDWIWMNTGPTG
jgi:hypothetical protein